MRRLRGAPLALAVLALVIAGCQMGELRTRKVLPEWSRGQRVGVAALNQPVAILAQDQVHMVWVAAGGKALHHVRLDDTGRVQLATDLGVYGAHPVYPRLALGQDGTVRVLWMDNPDAPRGLYLAQLSSDGRSLSEPRRLSTEGVRVSQYDVALSRDHNLDIFWATENSTDGGLYHLRLSGENQIISGNRLVARGGQNPTVRVALDGAIHLAWLQRPALRENSVYYAVFNPTTEELGAPTQVGFYRSGTGLVSYGPVLGLDGKTAYVFWALEQRGGGLTPGEAKTCFVSFPLDNPDLSESATVDVPSAAKPRYQPAAGSLPYQQLASADAGSPTSFLYMPATVGGQREELGVFLAGQVDTRSQSSVEVVWAIFADGTIRGYQLPVSVGNTMRPTGVIDGRGNVHLIWLRSAGFGRYDVHYATTSESARANLDKVTLQDRSVDLLNALWSLAPAVGFFPPIFLLWGFASFVWVVGFYVVKVEGGLERRSARVALIIAMLLYLASKLLLMPAVLFYAPFVDELPASLQFVPVLSTPLFTLLVGLGALALYFRRTEYRSLFVAYVIFVLTDSILSLLIYVPHWIAR